MERKNITNPLKKTLLKGCFLLFLALFSTNLNAQVTVDVSNQSLKEILKVIETKSEYRFFYNEGLKGLDKISSLRVRNATIEKTMTTLLANADISFKLEKNNLVVLVAKINSNQSGLKKISGLVTDQKGEPIIGASMLVKGTNIATITNTDGLFTLEVQEQSEISISYLGYKQIILIVGKANNYKIIIGEDSRALDEVVVVGYGTQNKLNLTGSVSMITSKDLTDRPITNLSTGLQGLLSGVTVTNITGQPGTNSTSIRVRGIGTLGNANPLILIDGVEGDMSLLNPEDMQSVSVLKDAASASIYGARAANGVILVTTKKLNTKDQAPTITLNNYYGTQTPTRLPKMANAVDFMTLDNEARANVGSAIAWTDAAFDKVRTGSAPNYFGNTDWIGAVINNTAPQQNYALNVNGNLGHSGYMLSYRYFDQSGLTSGKSTGETRQNIRLKLDSRLLNAVDLTANIGYIMRDVTAPNSSLISGGGAIYNATRIAPNAPIRYTDGSWAYGGGNTNPVAMLNDGGNTTIDADELSVMGIAKMELLKGWDVTATYSIVNKNSLTNSLSKTVIFTNPEMPETPVTKNVPDGMSNYDLRQRQQSLIIQSNFEFNINKHKISGVGGFSQEWMVLRQFDASRINLSTEFNPTLNLGSKEGMSNDASASQWAIRSGFGRLNYNYEDRYLVEMNLRYDLSSRFFTSQRGGFFPSFSGAWRLTEEPFMTFSRDIFDNIKLRGSWGMLGNQYVGSSNYPYMSVLNPIASTSIPTIGTLSTNAYSQTTLANPNLTWEKIDMLDFGIDFSLLKNRLNLTFDWYDKNTNGILLRLNYPTQIGASPSEENVGSVNNTGWEFDLGWRDKIGKVEYGMSFNLSDVKNVITDLGETLPDLGSYRIRRVGDPIDAFYGYISEGLMTPENFKFYDEQEKKYYNPNIPVVIGNNYQPGDIKYQDISGPAGIPDGRISPEYDRVVLGSALPRFNYSFRGDVKYSIFDMSFMIQGVGKGNGYLQGSARGAFQDMAGYPQEMHMGRYNVITNPDPDASYPRLTYNTPFNQTFSTFWLEDASYLRVKNIQLGFTMPTTFTRKMHLEKCRIYASADNMFTISNFFYAYDPETPVSSGGYYPQVKTFVVGFNLTFQ